jgi:diaminopimelate decarboxylase
MLAASPDLRCLNYLEPRFARVGLALETTPEAWTELWDVPAVRAIAYIDVPARFNPYPFATAGLGCEHCPYSLHLALIEYLSRFDPSCLLALPGPSLCAPVLLALGTESQINRFFERFCSSSVPHRAFFAVTEPEAGSDATAVRSQLSGAGAEMRLNAAKMLIGGVQTASVGLTFARREHSQELCLVMIEPGRVPDRITCEPLPVCGLAGAGLSRLLIRDCPIGADDVIGADRRSLRNGLNGIQYVFERHRPMVGAMALGAARGLLDALECAGVPAEALALYKLEHAALYELMMRVAVSYEERRLRGHQASLFKIQATRFAERVAHSVPALLSPSRLISSALLRKKYRDIFAFEYMEGTSNIQFLNAYRAYVASREHHDSLP